MQSARREKMVHGGRTDNLKLPGVHLRHLDTGQQKCKCKVYFFPYSNGALVALTPGRQELDLV